MRVLFWSEHAPDPDALGGVAIHVADLARNLSPHCEPLVAHRRGLQLVVEAFRPSRRVLAVFPAGTALCLQKGLSTTLSAVEADVFHAHSPAAGVAEAARASGTPLVLTLHDIGFADPTAAQLVAAADVAIAPSRFIRDLVGERHPALLSRTRVLSWGVLPQRRVSPTSSQRLRVAIVGVLAADKGAERLPDLMRACARLDIEWHLFGATEGRSLCAIRRAAARVHTHGSYRRHELGARLDHAGAHVALLASVVPESFSMTLSECMAAGVPVVASNLGAFPERVTDERCGWLFDPQDPDSLAELLATLFDATGEPSVTPLPDRALPTIRAMAAEHESVYRQLALRDRTRPSETALAEARRRFEAGTPSGTQPLWHVWHALRRTRFYRELPLRRLLSERRRREIERRASSIG